MRIYQVVQADMPLMDNARQYIECIFLSNIKHHMGKNIKKFEVCSLCCYAILSNRSGRSKNTYMQEIFLKLIEQLNGSVFTLLALLFVAFWAIFKIGRIVETFGMFKDKNTDLDKHVSTMKDSLSAIKATTDLLYQAHLSTVKSHSPLSLTEKGFEISQFLKLEEVVSSHWALIEKYISKKNPVNPYDIQVVTMDIAPKIFEKLFSDSERNAIKEYAYNTGVNLLEIYPIIGIISRDRFLVENGFSVSEVDKHAPKS